MVSKMAVLALALAAPLAQAAGLTADEQKIVAAVQSHHAESEALLERLVNVNSGTLNLAGVKQIADMLRPEFEKLGLTCKWLPMNEVGRAGHLVAEHHAKGAKRVLLIAHLDTVFEADSPFQKYVKTGETAEGPGVGDIKGGVVVILDALNALKQAGLLSQADVTVFLTGDEERAGHPIDITRRDLIAAAKANDLALDFETMAREGGQDTIHIGRRSSTTWKLKVTGVSGHSSGVGESAGFGANYELARIIDEFRRTLPEPNLTFNTSLIAGGTTAEMDAGTHASASGKDNIIAGQAVAAGDIRTLTDEQLELTRAKMRAIVGQHLSRTNAEISFEDGYPSMAPTPASQALFDQLAAVNADLGLAALRQGDPAKRGAGDISFVASILPGLVGMGVSGKGAHAVGETADLTSIDPQAERTAILIARLSKK
jgi:glutamate carboxypeptidase